jgi:hypothetical protein
VLFQVRHEVHRAFFRKEQASQITAISAATLALASGDAGEGDVARLVR